MLHGISANRRAWHPLGEREDRKALRSHNRRSARYPDTHVLQSATSQGFGGITRSRAESRRQRTEYAGDDCQNKRRH